MKPSTFKIDPQADVGKTEVQVMGSENELKSVKRAFKQVKSSEIYPAVDSDFKFTMYFYTTDQSFVMSLRDKCSEAISERPADSPSYSQISDSMSKVKTLALVFFAIAVLYFLFEFFTFMNDLLVTVN